MPKKWENCPGAYPSCNDVMWNILETLHGPLGDRWKLYFRGFNSFLRTIIREHCHHPNLLQEEMLRIRTYLNTTSIKIHNEVSFSPLHIDFQRDFFNFGSLFFTKGPTFCKSHDFKCLLIYIYIYICA